MISWHIPAIFSLKAQLRRTPLRLTASLQAFFYDPSSQLRRHLVHITAVQRQFLRNLLIRYIQAHEIQTQHPYFERLMMARKNGVGQIIEAGIAVVALIALTCRFRVIKAALDDLGGLTRGTRNAVWPAQLADGLIALHIINEIRDIDLHQWTPVRGWELRYPQYRTSSHATTLESDKSEPYYLDRSCNINSQAIPQSICIAEIIRRKSSTTHVQEVR